MQLVPPFDDPSWYRALDLRERLELLSGATGVLPVSSEAAERRLARWRSQQPFDDPEVFALRLANEGLSEDELRAALGTEPETLARLAGGPPPWLAELAAAWTPDGTQPTDLVGGEAREPFLRLLRPLVARGESRLAGWASALAQRDPQAPFDAAEAVALLRPALDVQLTQLVLKTLVLELNVARLQGQLDGDDAADRYRSFVERLGRREHAVPLLAEYPVLARLAVEAVGRWEHFGGEVLGHLAADREALEDRFGGGVPLGRLVELDGGVGDTHRGGRSVQLLRFSSGLRLVYKPRSLAVDVHFQALLDWLNERGDHPRFRTLRILDRGDHGWMEFVETAGCDDEAEVERFYRRQGGFLALLYVLEANDFHFENVLAAGEHPVLVDLESLVQQRVFLYDTESAGQRASSLIAFSVLRTGLLPQFIWTGDGVQLDMSGLGAEKGQVAVGAGRPGPDRPGTDAMRMVSRPVPFAGGRNRPTLRGEVVNAIDWAEAVTRGFESVYRTLLDHRDALLSPGGPTAAFAADEVRVILRHTRTYRALAADCLHPDQLRDALDRERYADRLWVGVGDRPEIARVAPLERREVLALDIPFFGTRPGERALLSGTGETLPGFFDRTGLEIVAEKLAGLGEEDLERQRWLIGTCLSALDGASALRGDRTRLLDEVEPASPERLVAAAQAAGDRLERLALIGADGEASWIGITAIDDLHYTPTALALNLYSGLAGVTLFLAYLADATGEPRYDRLARAAWQALVDQLREDTAPGPAELGAYTGMAGLVYTAVHLASLWDEPGLLAVAGRLAEWVGRGIDTDVDLDVISGAAGCIPALLALHRATGGARALDLAARCGEHLLAHARPMAAGGLGWQTRQAPDRALSGLSHGASGFAWTLLELAAATGERRFREAASGSLAYERTLFDPEERNWRDLRSFLGPEGAFNTLWCNGAVGIGLTRIAMMPHLRGDELREAEADVEHALAATLRFGVSLNHSLCHGALGNLELLAVAGRRLGREDYWRRAAQAGAVVCEDVESGRFRCGVPGGYETPGMMDGLAGIGYGLLRLAHPDRLPSVLLLEPPVAAGRALAEQAETAAVAGL